MNRLGLFTLMLALAACTSTKQSESPALETASQITSSGQVETKPSKVIDQPNITTEIIGNIPKDDHKDVPVKTGGWHDTFPGQKPPPIDNLPPGIKLVPCSGPDCARAWLSLKGSPLKGIEKFSGKEQIVVSDKRKEIDLSFRSGNAYNWQRGSFTFFPKDSEIEGSVQIKRVEPDLEAENPKYQNFNSKLKRGDCKVALKKSQDKKFASIRFECVDDYKTEGEFVFPADFLLPES